MRVLAKSGVAARRSTATKRQGQPGRVLAAFRNGSVRNLVATVIPARGIAVGGITHVVNYDMPSDPESYVHRIGCTTRAGRAGTAISFCSVDELPIVRSIEKLIRRAIEVSPGGERLRDRQEIRRHRYHGSHRTPAALQESPRQIREIPEARRTYFPRRQRRCQKVRTVILHGEKYIYGGNHSFLVLHDFLEKLAQTPLELLDLRNDRYSYFLTFQQWARNFDANKAAVIERFGEFNYRRFRLYPWGAAYEFLSSSLSCYR